MCKRLRMPAKQAYHEVTRLNDTDFGAAVREPDRRLPTGRLTLTGVAYGETGADTWALSALDGSTAAGSQTASGTRLPLGRRQIVQNSSS